MSISLVFLSCLISSCDRLPMSQDNDIILVHSELEQDHVDKSLVVQNPDIKEPSNVVPTTPESSPVPTPTQTPEPSSVPTPTQTPEPSSVPTPIPEKKVDIVNPYIRYTYENMIYESEELAKKYPDMIVLDIIGKSVEGRELLLMKLGRGDKKIILCGSHHAREYITSSFLMKMTEEDLK